MVFLEGPTFKKNTIVTVISKSKTNPYNQFNSQLFVFRPNIWVLNAQPSSILMNRSHRQSSLHGVLVAHWIDYNNHNNNNVLSCALLLVFSGLKWHILVTQFPKYTRLKRLQTSSHLCTPLSNPYLFFWEWNTRPALWCKLKKTFFP